jgi:hypothetical protein
MVDIYLEWDHWERWTQAQARGRSNKESVGFNFFW